MPAGYKHPSRGNILHMCANTLTETWPWSVIKAVQSKLTVWGWVVYGIALAPEPAFLQIPQPRGLQHKNRCPWGSMVWINISNCRLYVSKSGKH